MAEARPLTLRALVKHLDAIAPERLAEPWDNVGLLVGDPDAQVRRALVCIDFSPAVQDERRAVGADVVLAYHPPVFKAEKRALRGSVMFDAAKEGYGVYAPHTALDVANGGTNDVLADAVGMTSRAPLRITRVEEGFGLGRVGPVEPIERTALIARIKAALGLDHLLVAGPTEGTVDRVAVGAGACGDLLKEVLASGAGLYLTGEMRHHDALRAASNGLTVVCALHSNSERITLAKLAARLGEALPAVTFTVSSVDRDPFAVR